jgi:hypothetical protein
MPPKPGIPGAAAEPNDNDGSRILITGAAVGLALVGAGVALKKGSYCRFCRAPKVPRFGML